MIEQAHGIFGHFRAVLLGIVRRIYLSEKTVRNYVSAILAKLSVTSRAEAAVYAVRHNIEEHVPPDPE